MSEIPKDSEGAGGLSNWELALYIGIPVTAFCVAGCAYLYLKRKGDSKDSAENDIESSSVDSTNETDAGPENNETAAAEKVSILITKETCLDFITN